MSASERFSLPSPTMARRAACDRCRAQKLRCVRDIRSTFAQCERCATAKVTCNFGIAKPAGRPPGTCRPSTKVKSGYEDSRSPPEGTGSQSALDISGAPDVFVSSTPSLSNDTMARQFQAISPESSNLPSPPPMFGDSSMAGILDVDRMNLDVSDLNSPQEFPTHCNPQTSFSQILLPSPISSRPSTAAPGTYTINFPDSQGLDLNGLGIDHLVLNGSEPYRWGLHGDLRSGLSDTREPRQHNLSSGERAYTTQQYRIQCLSELNMNFYHLLTESSDLQQTMGKNGQQAYFPNEFAGKLLKNSIAFLDLLRSFQQSGEQRQQTPCIPTPRSFSRSPSTDSSFDETFLGPPSLSRTAGDAAKQGGRNRRRQADMTVILQLLACYLGSVQLHNILYTTIYHYIMPAAHRHRNRIRVQDPGFLDQLGQLPPIFHGLHIGGVSLDGFGSFQIKLILQISAHILGEIEQALGLPEGYRVSRKRDDEACGILGVNIPPQFLEMAMSDHESTGEAVGYHDSISGSRAQLGKLRGLLKGSINI